MNKLIKILRGKRKDKKGFTLMEMLIVVAIIAVLVAIAVPTFNSSLDKARKAADDANIRTAYMQHVMFTEKIETEDATLTKTKVDKDTITLPNGEPYVLQYYTSVDDSTTPWSGVEP